MRESLYDAELFLVCAWLNAVEPMVRRGDASYAEAYRTAGWRCW